MLLTATALGAAALAIGYGWRPALALGLILALSSTAMVLQTLEEKGWMRTAGGQNAFAVLLFQDISVIPLLAALPLLAIASGRDADPSRADAAQGWAESLAGWQQVLVIISAAWCPVGVWTVRHGRVDPPSAQSRPGM